MTYKVERSDGENETFKRSVFSPVPDTLRVPWGLDSVQLLNVLDTESQEINSLSLAQPFPPNLKTDLCGSVNFGLPSVLSLSQHGCSHDLKSVLSSNQISSLEEDSSPISPWHILPFGLCLQSAIDSSLDSLGSSRMVCAEVLGVVVGHRLGF